MNNRINGGQGAVAQVPNRNTGGGSVFSNEGMTHHNQGRTSGGASVSGRQSIVAISDPGMKLKSAVTDFKKQEQFTGKVMSDEILVTLGASIIKRYWWSISTRGSIGANTNVETMMKELLQASMDVDMKFIEHKWPLLKKTINAAIRAKKSQVNQSSKEYYMGTTVTLVFV